jgi:hypothetical protein
MMRTSKCYIITRKDTNHYNIVLKNLGAIMNILDATVTWLQGLMKACLK